MCLSTFEYFCLTLIRGTLGGLSTFFCQSCSRACPNHCFRARPQICPLVYIPRPELHTLSEPHFLSRTIYNFQLRTPFFCSFHSQHWAGSTRLAQRDFADRRGASAKSARRRCTPGCKGRTTRQRIICSGR